MTSDSHGAEREVLIDGRTRLPNRLHFEAVYRIAFAAGTRGFPISVLLMDVPVVATAGDAAVAEFGGKLASLTRDMDLVARLDDTRFVALLLGCNVHGGRIAADRVLSTLDPWLQSQGASMNIGVAAYGADMKLPADLMAAAEVALRHAKGVPGTSVET